MKEHFRRYASVGALLGCLVVSFAHGEGKFQIGVPDASSGLTETGLRSLNQALLRYPRDVRVPSSGTIIVKAGLLVSPAFGDTRVENVLEGVDGDVRWVRAQVHLTNGHGGYVVLRVATNAVTQMNRTITYSYLSHGLSSRPNTWSGANVCNVEIADFIGHYAGGTSIKLMCCAQNLGIEVNSLDGDPQRRLTREESEGLANSVLTLFLAPHSAEQEARQSEAVRIQYKVRGQGRAVVSWVVDTDLRNHWVRMDVERGRLTILDGGKVLLENLPIGGTKLCCSVISPEGKQVAARTLEIK